MIIVFGEILIDRFPDYERIGGAPFNFAYHLKQLGLPVRFITRVGDDAEGGDIRRMLKQNRFAMVDVQVDPHHATGRVEVTLDADGIPCFDIRRNAAYDHIDPPILTAEDLEAVEMIYFGSLVQRTANGRQQVRRLVRRRPEGAKCFCDINLRPPHVDDEAVTACLQMADILKLNAEELEEISRRYGGPQGFDASTQWLMQTYALDTAAVTLGAAGSRVVTSRGMIASPPIDVPRIKDTVGAGDAYAAVLAAGILRGMPMDRTLAQAARFAGGICAIAGAIPDSTDVYTPLRRQMERIHHGR